MMENWVVKGLGLPRQVVDEVVRGPEVLTVNEACQDRLHYWYITKTKTTSTA
jgi:hypothetical protein